jgi:glutathione peroxidase-family protein
MVFNNILHLCLLSEGKESSYMLKAYMRQILLLSKTGYRCEWGPAMENSAVHGIWYTKSLTISSFPKIKFQKRYTHRTKVTPVTVRTKATGNLVTRTAWKYYNSDAKCLLFFSDFNPNWNVLKFFSKTPSIYFKNTSPVWVKLFHEHEHDKPNSSFPQLLCKHA